MISTEIKVNGVLIYHVYAHNEGLNTKEQSVYQWQVVEIGGSMQQRDGRIAHDRSDGALKLIELILRKAQTR